MNWSFELSVGVLILLLLLKCGTSRANMMEDTPAAILRIVAPTSHIALSGDVTVLILASTNTKSSTGSISSELNFDEDIDDMSSDSKLNLSKNYETIFHNPILLRVLYQNGLASELVGEFPFEIQAPMNDNASVIIPCSVLSRGGTYTLQLEYKFSTTAVSTPTVAGISEIQMNSALQVQWPMPSLFLDRQHSDTYPSKPILATLKYSGITCVPSINIPVAIHKLYLIYCGYNIASCEPHDKNRTQVLYYENVEGFTSQKVIVLRCEFFGLAGNYVLSFRASNVNSTSHVINAYIKVEWSEEFKFNVHARSVYPCDGTGGVPVLFEYPSCRLQGDRVRVYGRLRADVASFAPPSTLHYITELKATPGKYTLNFDCDIFTEKFVEYCFVYVSQAITGAMAEIRIACIPTYPLQESDAGGWGAWSRWTPCSSSCAGGIRSRYRFCDTPPPRYGAKFCQGKAVETESCGGYNIGAWDIVDWKCRHGSELETTSSETTTDIGVQCRCGCIVSFREKLSRKVLTANTQACPGRSFWLLQAANDFAVELQLDEVKFPCPGQYFRVRDGDSLSANLLTDIAFEKQVRATTTTMRTTGTAGATSTIVSTGPSLLLEFFSDELSAATESCVGGFLARAAMLRNRASANGTLSPLVPFQTNATGTMGQLIFWMTPAHLVAASLLTLIFFISISLALQFAYKYRKYQIAEDLDSISDNFICNESMQDLTTRLPISFSSSTLISEVLSLVGDSTNDVSMEPEQTGKSCIVEDGYESSETQTEEYEDGFGASSETLKLNQSEESNGCEAVIPNKLKAANDPPSLSSMTVVGQPEVKYARPIKLRTLERSRKSRSPTPQEDKSSKEEDDNEGGDLHAEVMSALRQTQFMGGSSSRTSTLGGGKETKDRRNRERLLHGPSAEFNVSNAEVDLELDYYDYNVANAGAAPGSYLGMDPAFLVWIPPLASGDPENLVTDEADPLQGLGSTLYPSTEGLTLTPAEYNRIKLADGCASEISEGSIHSEQNSIDRRTRLNERLLPLHRILEDSRVRVSEESLSSHINRSATDTNKEPELSPVKHDNRLYEEQVQVLLHFSKCNNNEGGRRSARHATARLPAVSGTKIPTTILDDRSPRMNRFESHSRTQRRSLREERTAKHVHDQVAANSEDAGAQEKLQRTEETEFFYPKLNLLTAAQYRHRELPVNIPMTEFTGIPVRSPAKVLKYAEKVTLAREEIQSPDYGVETEINRDSHETLFFALNRCTDDGIKFADDDDDDDDDNDDDDDDNVGSKDKNDKDDNIRCIDNKILA